MARKTKTNEIEVTVHRVGLPLKALKVAEGTTVEDALEAAGLTVKNSEEVRINTESTDEDGEKYDTDTVLEDGDLITLVKRITGGTN